MTSLASAFDLPLLTADGLCPPAVPHDGWSFATASEAERPAVERFIADRFASAYGARIASFMPSLMALRRGQSLLAACGLRAAGHGNLFLESYLDRPVERVIAAARATAVDRRTVIEVGNLAIARAGAARQLIARLTRCLFHARWDWAVFTAVPALCNNFARLGIPLTVLGPADGDRLPAEERGAWGTYYDARPQVSAVSVAEAHSVLARAA